MIRTITVIIGLCMSTACADVDRSPDDVSGGSGDRSGRDTVQLERGPDTLGGGRILGADEDEPSPSDAIPPSGGDRRPNLEGIPNFEDVVALRDGDWIVLLTSVDGTYVESPGAGQAAGSVTEAPHQDLAEVQQRLWNRGYVPWVVNSEEIPGLEAGRTVLIMGPYPRQDGERRLAEVLKLVPGAQLHLGWPEQGGD